MTETTQTAGGPEADFRRPGAFIDSDHPAIVAFADEVTQGLADDHSRALALYEAVRDRFSYDVYLDYTDPDSFRASGVLARGGGFCVGKAALLAAVSRAAGIPSRIGFADVRNHMTSRRLHDLIGTDVFVWHAYTDLWLHDRWVKATPAFDKPLCDRMGIAPLDFDGRTDSLFQPIDGEGRRRMEYLNFRGSFADVPFDRILAAFREHYPALIEGGALQADFRAEAVSSL